MEAYVEKNIAPYVREWREKFWGQIRVRAGLRREHAALEKIVVNLNSILPDIEAIVWLSRNGHLVPVAHSSFDGYPGNVRDKRISLSSENFIGRAFNTREIEKTEGGSPSWPSDDLHDMGYKSRRWQTAYAYPLAMHGTLTVYTVGFSGLSVRERSITQAFADQLNATIGLHQRIRDLEAFSDIGNRLNLAFDEPSQLLNIIVETAANVLHADAVILHQHDPITGQFRPVGESVAYPPDSKEGIEKPREDNGISAKVRREGYFVVENVAEADQAIVNIEFLEKREVQAFIGVSLKAQRDVLGVLFFDFAQPKAFTRDDITLANLFADYSASAIRNARLLKSLKDRENDLKALADVGNALTSGLSLSTSEIVRLIYEQASRVMDMSNSYIALFDESKNEISFPLMIEEGEEKQMPARLFGDKGVGKTEWIIENNEPIFTPTEAEAKSWYEQPGRGEYIGSTLPSWIGVPMRSRDRVIGVIAAYHPIKDHAFGPTDLEVLQLIANSAAIALGNARIYESFIDRLSTLHQVGQQIASGLSLSASEIVRLIYEQASRVMDMSNSYIALFDESKNEISFPLMIEEGEEKQMPARLFGDKGVGRTEWIIENNEPIFTPTEAEAKSWYEQPGRGEYIGSTLASWIGVPMRSRDRVIGVIAAYHPIKDHVFDKQDLQLLEILASEAGIALGNARLYEERIEELNAVEKITRQINTAGDLETLLQTVVGMARDQIGADIAALYQYDTEFEEFYLQVKLEEQEQSLPGKGGQLQKIIEQGEIIFADNVLDYPLLSQNSFSLQRKVKSSMVAPLQVGQDKVGILLVNFLHQPYKFSHEDKRILKIIAEQAALAIQSLGRTAETNRQLKTVLRSVEEAKYSETLNDLLNKYLDIVIDEIGASMGSIQLYDQTSDKLVVRAFKGSIIRNDYLIIPSDKGITGRAFKTKEMVYLPDITQDVEHLPFFDGSVSELAIPLIVNDKPFGVLNVEHTEPNAFDIYKRKLFGLFAMEAAVLISERRQLELSHQRQIKTELELQSAEMTRSMAHTIKGYLGSARVQIGDVRSGAELPRESIIELLDRADANMKRCIEITQRLFKPYRPKEKAEIGIKLLVTEAASRLGKPENINLTIGDMNHLPNVFIEAENAIDFLFEILTNAVRAIQNDNDGKRVGEIKIEGKSTESKFVDLYFINNGPPIPEDQAPSIFEQFSGTPGSENSGLGLWGARTFFQRQRGDVTLMESDEEKTTFMVRMPTSLNIQEI